MIDNKLETTGQPKPERIVELGQEFSPLDITYIDPERLLNLRSNPITHGMAERTLLGAISSVRLRLDNKSVLFNLKMKIRTDNMVISFNPNLNYQFDSQDYEPGGTARKYHSNFEEFQRGREMQDTLTLSFDSSEPDQKLSEGELVHLDKIRMLLDVNGRSYTGNAQRTKEGGIKFEYFYPTNLGELPTSEKGLPFCPTYIVEDSSQLKAKFVLAPEIERGEK